MTSLTSFLNEDIMKSWQLQEAKARFSKVVRDATLKGPQNITVRGEPVVMIISITEFDKLTKKKPSFVQFMRQSPLVGTKIDWQRDTSTCREIEL